MNAFFGSGFVGQDPMSRQVNNSVVASFSLAMTRYMQGGQKKTTWVEVVCWGKQAQFVAQNLKKGASVAVSGRLDESQYQNQAGQTVKKIRISAQEVLSFKPPQQQPQAYQQNQQPSPMPTMDESMPF